MLALDLQISQYLFTLGRELPAALVRFLAADLFWVLLVFVLIISWQANRHRRLRLWLQAAAAAALALAANAIIGWLYWRQRPFVELAFTPLVDVSALGKSFPSDHAAAAFALAGAVWLQKKRSGSAALLAALLIALGRVLAGVHYAADIAVGAGIGLAAAWMLNRALDRS